MIRLPERPVLVLFEIGFVGDSLMTLPTLSALRRARPEAHLVRVVNAAMSELWENCPLVDELIPFDRSAGKLSAGWQLLQRVRTMQPAAFINLHTPDRERPARYYWRDAIFSRWSGASLRLGWSHGLDGLLLTHAVPRSRFGADNMALEMFRVAEPLAPAPNFEGLSFWHDDGHRAEGAEQLALAAELAGLDWPAPFLAVSPFGKLAGKELEAEDLAGLLERCWKATQLPAVLLGGPADVSKVGELRSAFRSPVLDLVGQNGLKVAAAILERASAVLAVDSGLMHLAALVGSPTVALFGPMPAHRWRPFRDERLEVFVGRTRGLKHDTTKQAFDLDEITAAVARAAERDSR